MRKELDVSKVQFYFTKQSFWIAIFFMITCPLWGQNVLKEVKVHHENDSSVIELVFSETIEPNTLSVTGKKGYFQMILPSTMISFPENFLPGDGADIQRIGVFQTSPTEALLRIYSNHFSDNQKEPVVKIEENRAIVEIANPVSVPLQVVGAPPTVEKNEKTHQSFLIPDNWERQAGWLSLALLVLFGLMASVPYIKKRRHLSFEGMMSQKMKVVQQIFLSPKAKLLLVQVGDEQILVSTGQDTVTIHPVSLKNRQAAAQANLLPSTKEEIAQKYEKIAEVLETKKARIGATAKKSEMGISETDQKMEKLEKKNSVDELSKLIRSRLKSIPKV